MNAQPPTARQAMDAVAGTRLRFAVTARPVPKARPRVGDTRTVTPERTSSFENTVGWAAKQAMMRARWDLLTGPVMVDLVVTGARANSDVDNLAKSVLDGLQGVVFVNDCQVAGLAVWRQDRGLPGVQVEVVALGDARTSAEEVLR